MKTQIIATLAGALIAGLIGWSLSLLKRSRDGRDRFLAEIGIAKSDLDAVLDKRPRSLKEFHATSCEQIRHAVFAVQPFIRKVSFERLLELLEKYKRINDAQLDVMKSSIGKRLQQFKPEEAVDPVNPVKDSEELLHECLAEFQKISFFPWPVSILIGDEIYKF